MTQQHEKAVEWAARQVGKGEIPLGSNRGPFVESCQAVDWIPGGGYPWCVDFWLKAWTVAGRKLPYLGAGAYSMLDWYRKNLPAWVVPLSKARPGSAVILNIGAGHCALLAKPYVSGGDVHTIDGNWGDRVTVVTHQLWQVRGVVDPPEDIGIVKPAKPPMFEVVTSASGTRRVVYVSGLKAIGRKLPQLLARFGTIVIRKKK